MMNLQEAVTKNLIMELGIDGLPQEIQEQTINQFTENVFKKIAIKIFDLLPEEKKNELLTLQSEGDSEKIQSFLGVNIPGFENVIIQTVEEAKEEYKNIVEELTK